MAATTSTTSTTASAASRHLSLARLRSPKPFLPLSLKTLPKPSLSLRHRLTSSSPHRHLLPISATASGELFPSSPGGVANDQFPLFDDKPREECGVVGIIGDPEASSLCCLALHALQHRGQEGAGIAASDSTTLRAVTGLGLVSEVFSPAKLDSLPGSAAIGHVRYSTAGAASSLMNVQPFVAGYRFGQLAVAHNGNLVNYAALRANLEARGSIFNTSSDTEVLLHLIATSTSRPLLSRLVEACCAIEGAYSLVFLTAGKLFAVRDPHGFRPLVMGRLR